MARASDILAKLLLVQREDADAAPPARNGHIPLLRVRRWLDGRIGEQDVSRKRLLHAGRRCLRFVFLKRRDDDFGFLGVSAVTPVAAITNCRVCIQ